MSKLKHVSKLSSLDNKREICITCPMAKFTKLPYPTIETKFAHLFELIYIDIWGAYRIATKGKYRFFLTIVEDFSRTTRTYLIEHKSQALDNLPMFLNFLQTHFHCSVKIIRLDNALKFDSDSCRQFFALKKLFIKLLVLTGHNKMTLLRKSTGMF